MKSKNKKILVIEDDPFISDVYVLKLESEGYKVDAAENGSIGLEKIKNNKYDAILLDIVMPELASGIVASRKLTNPSSEEIYLTYEMALVILFRLLFLAYAEDRDLLPYKSNELYRRRSLKLKAQELASINSEVDEDDSGHSHWIEAVMLFDSIYSGYLTVLHLIFFYLWGIF
jgi:CheY-like chemotaxis protein